MIRVVVADDHPVVREGIRRILDRTPDIEVAAEAADGAAVLEKVAAPGVNVLLLDIEMPGPGFIELLRIIGEAHPRVRVLVLSAHTEEHYAVRALRAGAAGYMTKTYFPDDLVEGIRRVATGRTYVSEHLAEHLASSLLPGAPETRPLSEREYQVLSLLAAGKSLKEVAAHLGVNAKTVSTYRARLLEKLGLKTNADLVRYALDHDIVS